MNKILLLDRTYSIRYVNSDKYEFVIAALSQKRRKQLQKEGFNVIACFEEEFSDLPIADFEDNYLTYSYDTDRFLKKYPFEERRVILGKEISFWRNILDKYNPSFIINEVCTIEWMEVLYIEAKKRGIKYYAFSYGQVPHTTYWLDTPFNASLATERLDVIPINDEMLIRAKNFCDNIIYNYQKPFYANIKHYNRYRVLLSSVKEYVKCRLEDRLLKGFHYECYKDQQSKAVECACCKLFRKYDVLDDHNNAKIEYVFYPLHYEPEATISYYAEFYSDQAHTIKMISHCLKTNQKLIVKEHPQQSGMLLTRRFQKVKETNKNIAYIPSDIPMQDIMKISKLMVTLSGTAGFETMIIGKPVIVLGDVFYNSCRSVSYCNSFKDLKELLRNDTYNKPDEESTYEFVAKFLSLQNAFFPYFINNKYDHNDINNMKTIIDNL